MKIKMRTLDSSPAGVRFPGAEYVVQDAEGKMLCDGGYAELVVEPKPIANKTNEEKSDKPQAVETADASPAPESASLKHVEKKGTPGRTRR